MNSISIRAWLLSNTSSRAIAAAMPITTEDMRRIYNPIWPLKLPENIWSSKVEA